MASKKNVPVVNESAFGGGFDPRANRAKKGEPRRAPIRHVYGVKLEREDGTSEWVLRGVLKGAAGMVQTALNIARDNPEILEGTIIVLVDMGPSAEYQSNGTDD